MLAARLRLGVLLPAAALLVSCSTSAPRKESLPVPNSKLEAPRGTVAPADPSLGPPVVVENSRDVVTLKAEEPVYAPPESLKLWRGGKQPPTEKKSEPAKPKLEPLALVTTAKTTAIATVDATDDGPRYALPESLSHWQGTRTAPLYADPNVEQWQAAPTEARLKNAAVSCNYKDEGGVRGKVMLLVDDYKVSRFDARIEMPNGGVCLFDAKKMQQRPFEQGLALESKNDECVIRMWEQKHRITVAAYSCHRQCSKGSFSYLWPILMDTRLGTCY